MEVTFNGVPWYHALEDYEVAVSAVRRLVLDKQSLTDHVHKLNEALRNRLREASPKTTDEAKPDPETDEIYPMHIAADDLRAAYKILCRQSIVIVVAHIEEILKEYLRCLFFRYPGRMHDYLRSGVEDGTKGKIDLKEIIEASTKDALIYGLASQAASTAFQGKFATAANSLVKLTKQRVDKNLLSEILKLVEQRNRIVHELSTEQISGDDVEAAFLLASTLLWHLEAVAIELEIPVAEPERAKQGPVSKDGQLWFPTVDGES